jgi:hypothetical protein
MLEVRRDGIAAEHDVAELMSAQKVRGRHHPSHAERRPDGFGLAAAV